jgi:hypothetical protein
MASNEHKKGPGGHYSGSNPVPNIQKFIESMDRDKKNRDARIDAEMKVGTAGSDVKEHKNGQNVGVKGSRKMVTDPTTGKQVQIEDVNADFMKSVEDPQVSKHNFRMRGSLIC